nr:50S ribosomal protein L35ae [Candidatus Sigynarchaeota archaeon]
MTDATIIKTHGVITSFRRGRSRQHETQILCKFDGYDNAKTASKLIGHELEWVSPTGLPIRGKITRTHGIKGVVRVQLGEKGMPGQAIGHPVTIIK